MAFKKILGYVPDNIDSLHLGLLDHFFIILFVNFLENISQQFPVKIQGRSKRGPLVGLSRDVKDILGVFPIPWERTYLGRNTFVYTYTHTQFVSGIGGCFYNVMGFPMHAFCVRLAELLDQKRLSLPTAAP